jgi:ABC-type multidrug transport system fused ATPase/permease subunit
MRRSWFRLFKSKGEPTPRPPPGALFRLLRTARPEKWLIGASFITLGVSTVTSLSLPYTVGKLVDASTGDEEKKAKVGYTPQQIAGGMVVLFCFSAAATFGTTSLLRVAGERLVRRTRVQLFAALMRQPILEVESKTGELVSRMSTDTQLMSNAISENASVGTRKVLEGIGTMGVLVYLNPVLTGTMVAVLPIFFGSGYFGRWVKKQTEIQLNRLSESTHVAEERLQGIRTVRSFATEDQEEKVYENKLSEVYQTALRLAFGSAFVYGGTNLALNCAFLAVLFHGSLLVSSGVMTLGELTSFLMYSGYLGMSFNGILKSYTELMKGVGASSRVLDLIEKPAAVPARPSVVSTERFRGRIELRDVHFAYADRPTAPVLRGLSLTVEPGQSLALVGYSGSGKSTIISLLMKFFVADSGSVLVGGRPLEEVEHHWWMSRIGFVSQDVTLFSGTLLDNLRFANREATLEQVKEACMLSNASQFIDLLPNGYETVVGPRGLSLSGGQRQRIAIARALLHAPDVLLLDEPTSALDFKNEILVRDGLAKAMAGRTSIICAHRLSTIKHVDKIAICKAGQIVDSGTHEELMSRKGGFYKKLVNSSILESKPHVDETTVLTPGTGKNV